MLIMSGCSSIIMLPETIADLAELQQLDLSGCSSLTSLPESFGGLCELQQLNLSGCSSLISLPKSLVRLSKLQQLDLCQCYGLYQQDLIGPEPLSRPMGTPHELAHLPAILACLPSLYTLKLSGTCWAGRPENQPVIEDASLYQVDPASQAQGSSPGFTTAACRAVIQAVVDSQTLQGRAEGTSKQPPLVLLKDLVLSWAATMEIRCGYSSTSSNRLMHVTSSAHWQYINIVQVTGGLGLGCFWTVCQEVQSGTPPPTPTSPNVRLGSP
jgi:hypothetical protein